MMDPATLERLLSDDRILEIIVDALGIYRSAMCANQDTSASPAEAEYFRARASAIEELLRTLDAA